VPDHLQWHRVSKLKEMGVQGWRTAHNPPTPALLDATDAIGMVVWDGEDACSSVAQAFYYRPVLAQRTTATASRTRCPC